MPNTIPIPATHLDQVVGSAQQNATDRDHHEHDRGDMGRKPSHE